METTRRHFLKGFAGCVVVASLPGIVIDSMTNGFFAGSVGMPPVQAPDGMTYQWIRSSLLGEPDVANIEWRLSKGWTFVSPLTHPELPTSDIDDAIGQGGLVLMQKPTIDVEAGRAAEQALATGAVDGLNTKYGRGAVANQ
jgi:hypothetical protein